MRSLYLRNVPDEVAEALERLAAREGMSLSAVAVRELTEASRRANNPRLLAALPHLDVPAQDLVGGLDADRAAR